MSNESALANEFRSLVSYDESLQSHLIRRLLSYDPTAKPVGIISESGRWANAPFIQKDYEHLFHNYPDHLLLEMIDIERSIDGGGNLLFDDPSSYTSSIFSTFFSGRSNKRNVRSSTEIRYCQACIKESIEKVGYGYFRYFWNYSDKCLIHNQPIHYLPELGFNKAIEAVKEILLGRGHERGIPVTNGRNKLHESQRRGDGCGWNQDGKYYFPIKLAVGCLMDKFAEWVSVNSSSFENPDFKRFSQNASSAYLYDYNLIYEGLYRRDFARVYLLCASLEPAKIEEFFRENVTLVCLQLGPRKQGRLKEIFGKNKESNCNRCRDKSCSLRNEKELQVIDLTDINATYLVNNSYSLSRIVAQKRDIFGLGGSVLGALDVSIKT